MRVRVRMSEGERLKARVSEGEGHLANVVACSLGEGEGKGEWG